MKITKTEDLKIINASDKVIDDLAGNNLVYDYGDFNLHYRSEGLLKARKGSVFDGLIFGSIFSDSCNCGRITRYNIECSKCQSVRLEDEKAFMRFGKIELPVYYLSNLNLKNFQKFFRNTFKKTIADIDSKSNLVGVVKNGIPFPNLTELFQFNYDPESETLVITDKITDISACSYEGLLNILTQYMPSKVNEYLSYINKKILVTPLPVRPTQIEYFGPTRNLKMSPITTAYQAILKAVSYYNEEYAASAKNLVELNLINANLRAMIRSSVNDLSSLIKGSKENFGRQLQGIRIQNSGRCVIAPDPKLKLNEVSIPRSLMYEAAGEGFIKYLTMVTDYDERQAKKVYTNNANSREIQDLFTKYVEGDEENGIHPLHVLINRQPTLYEDNYLFSRVILNNEEVMKIPLSICANFNADFDGDQMSFIVVNNDQYDYVDERLNAKNIKYKKKNLDPSFLPRQEILAGLTIATKIILPEDEGQVKVFDNLNEAEAYKKDNPEFKYQTQTIIDNKKTTIGRAKLSELFDTDLENYFSTCKNKFIDKKNVLDLYIKLHTLQDWVERQSEIEEFALLCVTLNGSTTLTLEKLLKDVDPKFNEEVDKIANSKVLNNKQKSLRYQELYTKYAAEHLEKYDEDIKNELDAQARASIDNLVKTSFPTMIVGLTGNFRPSKDTLINGLSARDYKDLSISSRGVSEIKVTQTPASGNTTRLLTFALEELTYQEGEDPNNTGIYLETWRATGRTKIDGTIVPKSNSKELVKVRSMITSTLPDPYAVTPDMISNLFKYRDGQQIGMAMAMIWNESTTQSALALKHKGQLFSIDDDSSLFANEECTVEEFDQYFVVKTKQGKEQVYPKPKDFILNYTPNNKYYKGDRIGIAWKLALPSYKLGQIIQLVCTRLITTHKSFIKNNVMLSECYCYESGTIHYEFSDEGTIVRIGDIFYKYNKKAMYFFPDGAYVERGQRICSGLIDIGLVFNKVNDYVDAFYFFDKQFQELTKTTNPELNEAIYKSIVYTDEYDHVILRGVKRTNMNRKAPMTRIAYESSKAYFTNVLSGNVTDFMIDAMTNGFLHNIAVGDIGLDK